MTINTLIGEAPAGVEPPKKLDDYAGADGIAIMCSNCRRVKRLSPPGVWEWIPELLWNGQVLTTFDLCDFCTAYHYHVSIRVRCESPTHGKKRSSARNQNFGYVSHRSPSYAGCVNRSFGRRRLFFGLEGPAGTFAIIGPKNAQT